MKTKCFLIIVGLIIVATSCKNAPNSTDDQLKFCAAQYADLMTASPDTTTFPRTFQGDTLVFSGPGWWTSGFIPGSLWYLFEATGDEKWKNEAIRRQAFLYDQQFNTSHHDLGFMMYCSYSNGLRLTGDTSYQRILLNSARSLSTRFDPRVGCIKSWDHFKGWDNGVDYTYPVIIDNMMNLELLFWATRITSDSSFYRIAVTHADTTLKNHFRPDYSSYHVVCYDTTGNVLARKTAQGATDESAWARGQAWGLYGYTLMYRETGLQRYLDQAIHIADFILNHPNLPADNVPYWDFNAPEIPNAKRDVSSASIIASALFELEGFVSEPAKTTYHDAAKKIIVSLSGPEYLAKKGENGHFILKHSVGSLPHNSEVDVPLTYADYYYIEALLRMKKQMAN